MLKENENIEETEFTTDTCSPWDYEWQLMFKQMILNV